MPAEVHGDFPEHILESVEMNKNGLISAAVKMERKLSAFDFLAALREIPETGLPCVGVRYSPRNGVAAIVYAYEGLDPGNTAFDETNFTTFELDVTMSEDPIRTHPNFQKLKEKYGWLADKETFPEFMPGSSGQTLPGSNNKQEKNDLDGADSYLAVGAVLRKTYVTRSLPQGLLKGIGSVVARPPGIELFDLPPLEESRNWLKLSPKIRKRGNCYEITEEWMLSGPRGWNKDVYDAGQLERR